MIARRAAALCMIAALVVALSASGCATLFAGGPDVIPVHTNPPGAYVYVNGQFVGQTPTVAALHRDHPGQIQIYLPGFQPIVMMREKHTNGWFIANIVWFYAIVPWIVDLVTGNYQRYDDTPIAIGLTPVAAQAPPPAWYVPPGPAPR